MERFQLNVAPELCTGCLRCQLACSENYEEAFCPSKARIQVLLGSSSWEIRFQEDCTGCGVCADNCLYGAISHSP